MTTDIPLSQSPPLLIPKILRDGSRSVVKEQLVPSSVLRSAKQAANHHSPTSTNTEDLATKQFEEQLALLDASSSKLIMNNHSDQSASGSEEDEQLNRICRMNNISGVGGPIQIKFNRTQNVPLKNSPMSNDVAENDDESTSVNHVTKKKRLHKLTESVDDTNLASSSTDENLRTKKAKLSESMLTKNES
mgnify:FL=1